MKSLVFLDFPDMQTTVKLAWDSNLEHWGIICGTTYLGHAQTIDDARQVALKYFSELMS